MALRKRSRRLGQIGRNDLLCVINCSSQLREMSKITKIYVVFTQETKLMVIGIRIKRYTQAGRSVRQGGEEKDNHQAVT